MASNEGHSQQDFLSQSQLLPSRPAQTENARDDPASSSPANENESSPDPTTPTAEPESDQEPDLPLSMSTSMLLHSPDLPSDARTALHALHTTIDPPTQKVTIRFHAVGNAPQLGKRKVFTISASSKFSAVVDFLGKKLYGKEGYADGKGKGLFCYVNSVFAPGLDEGVGGLWRCFKTDDQLIVAYSVTPAFG